MNTSILFVEDEERLRDVLLEAAALEGYAVEGVPTAEAALELLAKKSFDIIVTDVMLPGMSGLDLLPHITRLNPEAVAIVITAFGTIEVAVEAMKRGASDFLTKPFELDTLTSTIRVAVQRVSDKKGEADGSPSRKPKQSIVGSSPVMSKLLEQVKTVAPFNTTILVTGETGTGKELIARSIHQQSQRMKRSLVALNCAAIPEQLLEDELFGHVKGAFSGAQTAREGRFEQADGGSLFLDEIGDMSLPLQSKLLRVLQEREFERLGASRTIKVDVRVIAATSANLEQRMEEGTFRSDLFYRLNVVHLRVPPLRERPEDIPTLSDYLLARFCASAGLPVKAIDEEARGVLQTYHWPGNVRQLQNAMERAAALSGGATVIGLDDLPEEIQGGAPSGITPVLLSRRNKSQEETPAAQIPDEGLNFDAVVTKVERELLLESLNRAGGNKMQAAKLLNMKRTTFVEKLKRLQISAGEDS